MREGDEDYDQLLEGRERVIVGERGKRGVMMEVIRVLWLGLKIRVPYFWKLIWLDQN